MKDMKAFHEYARSRGVTDEMIAEARAELDAYLEAYNLAQTRKSRALTQREVAEQMGVSQKRVSELEHGKLGSMRLDTLRRYVESIGGKLVATAVFPDKTIELS